MPEGVFVKNKIKDQHTLGADSGTYTVDLPTANYLQGLMVRVQNTNGTTSNTGETIQGSLTKIEIVADGVVIYTMSGRLARKFEHFDIGDEPSANETQKASAVQWAVFPVKFGRDDFDKDVILPAHRFNTLQAKITWAFTDSTTAGWTTSETNAKLDVIGRYLVSGTLENTPFLKKIDVWNKTTSATGTEEANLPVGSANGAYRRLMLYAYEASIEDGTDVDKYEIIVNDSQRIVDERWDTSQAEDRTRYRARHSKKVQIFGSDTDTYASYVSRITSAIPNSVSCGTIPFVESVAGDTLTLSCQDFAGANSAVDVDIWTDIQGTGVSHATMVDIGTDNLADSLDVTQGSGVSSLKVKLNVAASGSDTRVITEQLVSF